MRISRRIRFVGIALLAVLFCVYIFHITIDPELPLLEKVKYFDFLIYKPEGGWKYSDAAFRESDLRVRSIIHYKQKVDRVFESFALLKDSGLAFSVDSAKVASGTENSGGVIFDMTEWRKLSLNEQCNKFFGHWKTANPDWSFDKFEKRYDKSIVHKRRFFADKRRMLKEERVNNRVPEEEQQITEADNDDIERQFEEAINMTIETQNKMVESMSLIRAFGKCYVNSPGDDEAVGADQSLDKTKDYYLYADMSKKLFPFFNGNLPTYEKFDGFSVSGLFPGASEVYNSDKHNIFDYIKRNSNGRGIVLSASTRHARDVIKLVRILRALNNRLPIQIFHKGDISTKYIDYITMSAQVDIEDLLDQRLSTEYEKVFPELNLHEEFSHFGSEFPKQDIWFVNIKDVLEKHSKYDFPGYANKLLALFYTSFKEAILLDADTVPLVNPETLFDSKEFQTTGAYFFKDRSLRDHNDFLETNYFSLLMPTHSKNTIEELFEIPVVTEHTLGNAYMTGWRHLQEAGVVLMDKPDHLLGIAVTLSLSLWKEPVKSSIWGDKELYWLGLSIVGDENYKFNEFSTASVGEMVTNPEFKYYTGYTESNELCSTHPGHVNSNGELVWINSGFSFCKKNGHFRDRNKFPFSLYEDKELASLYDLPLKITHALVPADLPILRPIGGEVDDSKELEFIEEWKLRPKDMDEINIDAKGDDVVNQITEWNPQKGWVKSGVCGGYYYCAYDVVDGYSTFKKGVDQKTGVITKGHLFEFPEEKKKMFEYLSKLWATGTTKFKIPTKEDTDKLKQEEEDWAKRKEKLMKEAELMRLKTEKAEAEGKPVQEVDEIPAEEDKARVEALVKGLQQNP